MPPEMSGFASLAVRLPLAYVAIPLARVVLACRFLRAYERRSVAAGAADAGR